jgi:hypothetical protein
MDKVAEGRIEQKNEQSYKKEARFKINIKSEGNTLILNMSKKEL